MSSPSSSGCRPELDPGASQSSASINPSGTSHSPQPGPHPHLAAAAWASSSPLSAACERAITDKAYDKRKAAAVEIEKTARDLYLAGQKEQISRLISILTQAFCVSSKPDSRKGGVMGLSAAATGMQKGAREFIEPLSLPVLTCMKDPDSRVRFYACESLYNIGKICRDAILPGLVNEWFVATFGIISDPDHSVRNAAELLDRLLKDIVLESPNFKVEYFIPLIRDRMYTQDPFARQFLLGWISALQKLPGVNCSEFVSDFLDALFCILDDGNKDTFCMCANLLEDLSGGILECPESINFSAIFSLLNVHFAQSKMPRVQIITLQWMRSFLDPAGPHVVLSFVPRLLADVLPILSCDQHNEHAQITYDLALEINKNLLRIVSAPSDELARKELDLPRVIEVLNHMLMTEKEKSRLAVMQWYYQLFVKYQIQMEPHTHLAFPRLVQSLADDYDEVVILCVRVVALICHLENSKSEGRFRSLIRELIGLFYKNDIVLDRRGRYVIRELCLFLRPRDIFLLFAEELPSQQDRRFQRTLVEVLNDILLTSDELYMLREEFKDISTKETWHFFKQLYHAWVYSPVSCLSLCLLAGCFRHAGDLVLHMGQREFTFEMLLEMDRLLQLIEAPGFSYLRARLLDPGENADLHFALSSLLMILPQTEAYMALHRRIVSLPPILPTEPKKDKEKEKSSKGSKKSSPVSHSDFGPLFERFKQCHKELLAEEAELRAASLVTEQIDLLDIN